MTDKLKEAIEVLKVNRPILGRISDDMMEAVDTVVAEVEKPTYTAEDMEAFAEWTAIMQWIYDPTDKCWFQKHSTETKTTAQLRELWEQEMDVNTSEPPNIKQQCPECGDESYNSDGDYCLNSNCKLFII